MARAKVGTRNVAGGVVGVVLRGGKELARTAVLPDGEAAADAALLLLAQIAARP